METNLKSKLENNYKESSYQDSYNYFNDSLSMYSVFKTERTDLISSNQSDQNNEDTINTSLKGTEYSGTYMQNTNKDNYLKLRFSEEIIIKDEIILDDKESNLQLNDEMNSHHTSNKTPTRVEGQRKRKKLLKILFEENPDEKIQRLNKEIENKKETKLFFESPEQRRKRLDAEADRKRKYRLFTESPEQKRKRLDKDAERRRMKRLSMYANETEEERRERLNRESAKKRKARLNKYAKETEEQRKERLKKDALRARELRFTRSVIETEEERRDRLIRDALRKRELRMQDHQTRKLLELSNESRIEELKESEEMSLENHYLSNWTVWFQNNLSQTITTEEDCTKLSSNDE